MIDGLGQSTISPRFTEETGASAQGTAPTSDAAHTPDAPLFAHRTAPQRGGWMSVLRGTIGIAAMAMLLGAAPTTAQVRTDPPASVAAAQLGTQSFAVGSPLAP